MNIITRNRDMMKRINNETREVMTAGIHGMIVSTGTSKKHDTPRLHDKKRISSAVTVDSTREARPVLIITSRLAIFIVTLLVGFASCVRDTRLGQTGTFINDGEALVTLSLDVPAAPNSRAMTAAQEAYIDQVDVLLFDAENNDKYHYHAIGSKPDNDASQKQFTVKLPTGKYRVVVLANARAMLAGYPPATLASTAGINKTRVQVLNELQFALNASATNAKWTTSFTHIPMWGYYKASSGTDPLVLTIGDGSTNINDAISLTRAISRVDVSVAAKTPAIPFTIQHVYLYNYSTGGYLAPEAVASGGVDGYTRWVSSGDGDAVPHLPANVKATNLCLEYAIAEGASSGKLDAAIYAFETAAATGAAVTNTCLVIGGSYSGGPETFYRVEIAEHDEDGELVKYLPFVRNHRYDVVIQDVKGHGYPRKEDAYANKPANITVNIVTWNDGNLNDVVFNGQHYLAVDKSTVNLYQEAKTTGKEIQVATDYPGGWKIENKPAWLIVDPASVSTVGKNPLTLKVDPGYGEPAIDGEFYIVAGNLRKKISVHWKNAPEPSIAIGLEQPLDLFVVGETRIIPYTEGNAVEFVGFVRVPDSWEITVNRQAHEITIKAPTVLTDDNREIEVTMIASGGGLPVVTIPVPLSCGVAEDYAGRIRVNYMGGDTDVITVTSVRAIELPNTGKVIHSFEFLDKTVSPTSFLVGRKEDGSTLSLKLVDYELLLRDPVGTSIPIGTLAEFRLVNTNSTTRAGSYKQEANLDFMAEKWTPVGSAFTGSFDGDNHEISRLARTIFSSITSGAEIRNVRVVSGEVSGQAAICGTASGSTITGCYNAAKVKNATQYTGGICGFAQASSSITDCHNVGVVEGGGSGDRRVGGIVAQCNASTISACSNTGPVTNTGSASQHYTGGIAGGGTGTIIACYNTGAVTGGYYVGGIAGVTGTGTAAACYNTGPVSGGGLIGGIAGDGKTLVACYNTGHVTATSGTPHGINGATGRSVTACYWVHYSEDNTTYPDSQITEFSDTTWPSVGANNQWGTVGEGGAYTYWKTRGGWNTGGTTIVYPKLYFEQ
jgi:hypothetical protein